MDEGTLNWTEELERLVEKLSPEALVVWLELERLGLEHRANEG
jgi:hypothetical protein